MNRLTNFFGFLLLVFVQQSCSPKLHLSQVKTKQYPISRDLPRDSSVLSYYEPYKKQLDSIMQDTLIVFNGELNKRQPEGSLNNFFADAVAGASREKGITFDMVYSNYGGLRVPSLKHKITRSNIFELMPFENAIVTVIFKGEDLPYFFDYMAEEGGAAISGARFKIDKLTKKSSDITINGQPIDSSKDYVILTSDYMANGGDSGKVFYRAKSIIEHHYKLRDALLDYLEGLKKSRETIKPVLDGRIAFK